MSSSKKGNSDMGSKKSDSKMDSLADQLKKISLSCDEKDKSDEKPDLKMKMGSPVSTLRTSGLSSTTTTSTTTASTRSSSNSSASISGQNVPYPGRRKSNSGKGSVKTSPTGSSGKRKSNLSSTSGESSSTSPAPARNLLPPCGNLFPSGVVVTTGMASPPVNTRLNIDGSGYYGYGSIMRRDATSKTGGVKEKSGGVSGSKNELEALRLRGNENYNKGRFSEALRIYDKGIAINSNDGIFHCNRAAALMGLKRLGEAVKACEEAIRLSPSYVRAHQRLGSLLLSFGQVENARKHFFAEGHKPDKAVLQKLQAVEKHISKCTDARKLRDWTTMLKETEAATSSGAELSPQLFACRAEAYLKLHQLRDAELWIYKAKKSVPSAPASQSKLFGMLCEAYIFFVEAQVDTAHGRFDNAHTAIERAAQLDLQCAEITGLLKDMRLVGRARSRGNELFKSAKYKEACAAYGEGLSRDSSNSILYCNRAACWYNLEQFEKCLDDCNHALLIKPNYNKALFRKAAANTKLKRWAEAVRDYEVLQRELPYDNEVAEMLFHAQVELKKSRGEEVHKTKFGGKVELVSDLDKFRAAIASSSGGASVVHFKEASDLQSKHMSPFLDSLSTKFPSVKFLKVDVELSPAIGKAENITTVPTFKIYKNGNRVMEMVSPSQEMLQSSIKHYSV